MRSNAKLSLLAMQKGKLSIRTALSTWEGVLRRVPQSSVFGPRLFNISVNDLLMNTDNAGLSVMRMTQISIVPVKTYVLLKTTLIGILRMQLHGLFKMA